MTRSEEHTSELPSLMRISYAVFCLKKKKKTHIKQQKLQRRPINIKNSITRRNVQNTNNHTVKIMNIFSNKRHKKKKPTHTKRIALNTHTKYTINFIRTFKHS